MGVVFLLFFLQQLHCIVLSSIPLPLSLFFLCYLAKIVLLGFAINTYHHTVQRLRRGHPLEIILVLS